MSRSRILATLSAVGLLAGTAALGAEVSQLQKATTLVKPAVVLIQTVFTAHVTYATQAGTQVFGPYQVGQSGSGSIINSDGFVLTNGHVVEAGSEVMQAFYQRFFQQMVEAYAQEQGRQLTEEEVAAVVAGLQAQGVLGLVNQEGEPILSKDDIPRQVFVVTKGGLQQFKEAQRGFPAEVRAVSPMDQKDIAILKISGSNFPSVRLGDSDQVQLQDTVTVIGFPGAVTQTFEETGHFGGDSAMEVTITQGIISSFKTWKDGSPILGTDAATTHSNSGGPAINTRGEVIGVLSMGALTPYSQAFGFNFLRPVNVAKDFIRASGVVPTTSLTDTRFAEAMEHLWQAEELEDAGKSGAARKEYEVAKAALKSVIDLYPQHSDAGRYVVRCEEALSRIPAGSVFPLSLALAVAGVVLLGLAVYAAVRRKQAATAGSAPPRVAPVASGRVAPAAKKRGGGAWELVAEAGPLSGNRFSVGPEGVSMGRDPGQCQVVCSGDTVSRLHARLQQAAEGLVLTNLSTTNPTYLNDQPVSQTTVKAGDRIRIGQLVLRVERLD